MNQRSPFQGLVKPLARLARGFSQHELAERAGIARETISRLEAGAASPRLATARSIVRVLVRGGLLPQPGGLPGPKFAARRLHSTAVSHGGVSAIPVDRGAANRGSRSGTTAITRGVELGIAQPAGCRERVLIHLGIAQVGPFEVGPT